MSVEIFNTNDRGFHQYGRSLRCTYKTEIKIVESSISNGPHVWIFMKCDPSVLHSQPSGEASAHLNKRQAQAIVNRLQAWIDEIPLRWEK